VAGDRLTGSDKRALLFWVVLGILGAVFAQKYFFRAFPEASVNFQVSRQEALKRAQNFVAGLGENINGYQSTIVFAVDDNAKVYLERQLGLDQANRLMSSELNIWHWNVRFFKPLQVEEFQVRVNPAGQVVGYEHKIEEVRPGAKLEISGADGIARDFLTARLNKHPADWDFLPEETSSKTHPNRIDWTFTWEKHGFRAKDAPDRLKVTIQGDRPGGAEETLHVPESWKRSYGALRSANVFYNQVAILPWILFLGSAIWVGISLARRGQTNWGGALKLGAIVALPLLIMELNQWPLARASYDTNSSYSNFVLAQVAAALGFALFNVLMIALVLPGGEPLYRSAQPDRLRLSKAFTLRGLRSKEFFSSSFIGLAMAAAHIGFIVAFYLIAGRFGAWAPQEVNYDNSVNTVIPWISGIAIGLLASTSEEFLFRLFAIPFLHRLTRSRLLSIIIPAFCWGFLHSAYPNEPPYIRGLEVGLIGVVAGIVMLRWGILATLIWHYTVDAALVGLLLIRSDNLYFKVSGFIVGAAAVAPLLFSGISYLVRGHFEPDEDLLNRAEPVPDSKATSGSDSTTALRRYDPLSARLIGILAVGLVVGSFLAIRFKPEAIGSYLRLSTNARSAKLRADEVLRARKVDAGLYRRVALLTDTTDPEANEFLRQHISISRINEICASQIPCVLWRVRYFREGQAEEYSVILRPDGELHSIHHKLAEEAAGASLTKEEAISRAEKFLKEEKKLVLQEWSLVESEPKKKPHRLDYSFTWQQNRPLDSSTLNAADAASHAYARITLQVLGDEVTSYRTYVKIPEDWIRRNEQGTLERSILAYAIPSLLGLGLFITALVFFFKGFRTEVARAVPWRRLAFWSIWGLTGYLLTSVLGKTYNTFVMNQYQTEMPYEFLLGILGIGAIVGVAFYFGLFLLLFGLGWFFAAEAFGQDRIPAWIGMPASYYRDALCIALGGAGILVGLEHLVVALVARWPTLHRATETVLGQDFDALLPAAALLGATLERSLLYIGILALAAGLISLHLRPLWLRLSVFVLTAMALVGSNWGTPADYLKQLFIRGILLSVIVFGVRRIARFNILGCFLALMAISLMGGATELLSQPDAYYRANGYAVLVFMLLLFAWPFSAWRMHSTNNPV
jgi:membrane protease YdiL (CAAX protease family)